MPRQLNDWTGFYVSDVPSMTTDTSVSATAGNTLVCVCTLGGNLTSSMSIAQAGWVKLTSKEANRAPFAVWHKEADGDSSDTPVVTLGVSGRGSVSVLAYDDFDIADFVVATSTSDGSASVVTSRATPSATTTGAGFAITIVNHDSSRDALATSVSVSPGEIDFYSNDYQAGGTRGQHFIGSHAVAAAGSESATFSWTGATQSTAAILLYDTGSGPTPGPDDFEYKSDGESGSIDWDGADIWADDQWSSAQAFGSSGPGDTSSWSVVSSPARAGTKSIRAELQESWGLTNDGRRRNEARAPAGRNLNYGDEHWFRVSVYMPDDANHQALIQSTLQNQTIFQFHWSGAAGSNHIHVYNGQFRLLWEGKYSTFPPAPASVFGSVSLGVWHDFIFNFKLHRTDGFVKVWHQDDGGGYSKVIDFSGYTIDQDIDLNPKIGIYRGDFESGYDHQIIYYDEYGVSLPGQGDFDTFRPGSGGTVGTEWTRTNITVVRDSGIDGSPNSASLLTATAADGTVIGKAVTAPSDVHSTRWFLKRVTGSGTVSITVDGGSTWQDVTSLLNTSEFVICTADQTLANPQIGIELGTSGDSVSVGNAELHLHTTKENLSTGDAIITISEIAEVYRDSPVEQIGQWDGYDQGTDQVTLSQLSRLFPINEGAGSTAAVDSLGDGSTDATYSGVSSGDWDAS